MKIGQSMTKKHTGVYLLLTLTLLLSAACATVPLIGRRQMAFLPSSQMAAMGAGNYKQVMSKAKLSGDREKVQMIKRVGSRISIAAEKFMKEKGRAADLKYYRWEYNLIDDDKMVNAWAMPGGKIAFYTGILKLARTEDEVAVIMGHEVAHVLLKHGNERMSQMLLVQFGGLALTKLLEKKPKETKKAFMTAFGMGAQVGVLLPFSRKHEYEADEIGLNIMYNSGYDPNAAVRFWTKMTKLGGHVPEFLSTHPASQNRVARMQKIIPALR
jgi:predicted Zn-dependent protease